MKKMHLFMICYGVVSIISVIGIFGLTGVTGAADGTFKGYWNKSASYQPKIHAITQVVKTPDNVLHVCMDLAPSQDAPAVTQTLRLPLAAYGSIVDRGGGWPNHARDHPALARERGYRSIIYTGYNVSFKMNALVDGCAPIERFSDAYTLPIEETAPFDLQDTSSTRKYPVFLDITGGHAEVIYQSSDVPRLSGATFIYATRDRSLVERIQTSKGDSTSNYIIFTIYGDVYYPNAGWRYARPLAVAVDLLTAPLQVLGAAFMLIVMAVSGVK